MLDLAVTSMSAATFGGSATYPSFYTKEKVLNDPAHGDFLAAQMEINVNVVPEPESLTVAVLGAAILLLARFVRRPIGAFPNFQANPQ